MSAILPPHQFIPEPKLSFHPDRAGDCHKHPLKGLIEFGPYSRSLINNVVDPIRIAFIVPNDTRGMISRLFRELETEYSPLERKDYLVKYPGFSKVFGLRIIVADKSTWITLPPNLDNRLETMSQSHRIFADELSKALATLAANRPAFDVVLIYLPERWEKYFLGSESDDFDLHDYLKAQMADMAIPTQIVLESGAFRYRCRASVMWRLAIALYCKAGGVPWKLAETNSETAYIVLSYALRTVNSSNPRFVTCCSQVFDSDGAGLEFLTYDTDQAYIERDNPFLNRVEMRKVMTRSLALYQRRHSGRTPKRVVIHKSTYFKSEEIDGCFDALQTVAEIELIHVQDSVMWRGVHLWKPPMEKIGRPGGYPVERGSFVYLSEREVLLWTQGNAPEVANGKDFYKEGKSIPRPILLKRYAGHGDLDQVCWEVLGLSKMDWNNDSLYNRLPVTLSYAGVLARTLKRMPNLSSKPYALRFFM